MPECPNPTGDDLYGYPFVIIGCGSCALGLLRPRGGGLWACRLCPWVGKLERKQGRLVQA